MNFYLSPTMFKMFIGYFLLAVYDPFAVVNDGVQDVVEVRIPDGKQIGCLLTPPLLTQPFS